MKTGPELDKEWTSRRPGPKGSVDMTMSMTGRERAEYLRWKKEREQIDEERLARHRNATGQWRREWDAQKSDSMFTEDPAVGVEVRESDPSTRRDDNKRPPKAPTFGDFLSQGRSHGSRGDRSRGKNRSTRPSYSMHDNRWETEKEEEKREKEDKPKQEEKAETEEVQSKTSEELKQTMSPPRALSPPKDEPAEDDEDEWEDASDGEEELEEPEPCPQVPKQQRTPRHKAHTLEPLNPQDSPEGAKPLSPFCPLDHKPVSDWGEEMELLSPRSSMGGESPLKPPSTETSPEQKKGLEGPAEGQGISGGQSDPDPADEGATTTTMDAQASAAEEPCLGSGEQSQVMPSCPGEEEQNQVAAEKPCSD